jgi:hypothetical protein
MLEHQANLAFDTFRDDVVDYLALRLDITREAALEVLRHWLVHLEPKEASLDEQS